MADLINLKNISDQLQKGAGLGNNIIDQNPNTGNSNYYGIKPEQVTDPATFYYKLTAGILFFVASAAVLVLIYGGLLYLTARDNAEQAERGKKAIIGAIVGIVIIAVSFLVYTTVMRIFARTDTGPQVIQEEVNTNPFAPRP